MKPNQVEDEYIWVQEMQQRMAKLAKEQQSHSEAEKERLKEQHWMHCPKCGDKMIPKNSSMYCERGKMMLTHTLYARFNARFIERVTEEPLLQRTQNPRGRFFCPACGQRMKFVGGYVQCPDSHGSITVWQR